MRRLAMATSPQIRLAAFAPLRFLPCLPAWQAHTESALRSRWSRYRYTYVRATQM